MNDLSDLRKTRRATLKDVALAAAVHVSTVSRALNPKTAHLITDAVRGRIEAVCRELDYRPNQTAYSLRTNRTRTIGVVIPDITNPVFPPIIRGIEDGLADHGYVAIMVNTDADEERESRMVETLLARSVDGLIMANARRQDATIEGLARRHVEVVTVNRRVEDPSVPSVVNDEESGVRRMLGHLVALGHRVVAHIGGPQATSTGRRRYESFRTSLSPLGLGEARVPVAFARAFNEAEGVRCADELLSSGEGFTAILSANDRLAIGAIAALRRRGLECPRDVSVTGFNDMPLADLIVPPLTTVRVQQYAAGRAAAHIMIERLEAAGAIEPRHEVMSVELVVRASSAPPPAG